MKQRLSAATIASGGVVSALTCVLFSINVHAEDAEALAKQLANPLAALISVPMQLNYDEDIGRDDDGSRYLLNVQPVLPIRLNADWNIISRTIVPVIRQQDVYLQDDHQSGMGDVVQSFFFSPQRPTANGWIWGAGPVLLLPTATDDLIGAEKWGLGPTAVALKQDGPITYGALANHLWSVAGDVDRNDINATYLQPFVAFTTKTATTFTVNLESTYDWDAKSWSVPLNGMVSQVLKLGNQLISVGGGLRYWLDSPDGGPEGFGWRLQLTLLFPK